MSKVPFRAALAATTAALLSGCASMETPGFLAALQPHPELEVRPLQTQSEAAAPSASDRLYRSAVEAIEARDYGLALERLQLARQQAPQDVRVLNALAVTYDKVGRFDLSARFYAEAAAVAPGSPVVSANLAYSQQIQQKYQQVRLAGRAPDPLPAPIQAHAPEPVLPLLAELMRPARTLKLARVSAPASPAPRQYAELMSPARMLKPAKASGPALQRATPALVGRPLMLVDAGGTATRVRTQLAGRGWSVASNIQRTDRVQASRILYPAQHERVALALARTLPFETAMTVCQDDCQGVVLLLGENATWTG